MLNSQLVGDCGLGSSLYSSPQGLGGALPRGQVRHSWGGEGLEARPLLCHSWQRVWAPESGEVSIPNSGLSLCERCW